MANRPTRPALSQEYIVDSSDDEDTGVADTQNIAGASTTPVRKKNPEQNLKTKKRKTATGPQKDSSTHQESPEEEQPDDDDTGEEEALSGLLDQVSVQVPATPSSAKQRPRKKQKPAPHSERSVPARPYHPPTCFSRLSSGASESAAQRVQFLTEDLKGKQVWHITAPANVSIDSIKTFDIAAAMKGEAIENTRGEYYSFTAAPTTNQCILTLNESGASYVPRVTSVHRTYHLQKVVSPPFKVRHGDGGRASGNKSSEQQTKAISFEAQPSKDEDEVALGIPKARPVRQQPKGLRMRYKPFGNTEASPEFMAGAEEPEAEPLKFDVPSQIPTPPPEKSSKKKKKQLHEPLEASRDEEGDAMDVDSPEQASAMQDGSSQPMHHIDNSPSKHAVTTESTTGQEKLKRKSKKHKSRTGSEN